MKKFSVSFAAAAVLAMTVVTGAVAAELPSYEKAGLPVSAVQLQVLGAENVSEQAPPGEPVAAVLSRTVDGLARQIASAIQLLPRQPGQV